jgi:putative ABC transport system permease protein
MLGYLSLNSLRQMKRFGLQSMLSVLGVAIGVANIILLISITDLGRRQTFSLIEDFGANLLIVAPFIDVSQGPFGGINPSQLSSHLPDSVRAAVAEADEIETVAAALLMPGHVLRGEQRTFTTVQGVSESFNILRGHDISAGRWLSAEDIAQRSRVACLCSTVEAELFAGDNPLGQTIEIKGERFEIIGLMEQKGRVGFEDIDNRVYIPLSTAQELYEFSGVHGMFARYRQGISEKEAIAAVRQQLQTQLTAEQELDETFSIFTIKEARDLLGKTMGIFRAVLTGIASIALLVAGLGIMNVMLIRVMQRRQEIGIRRAVGATERGIVAQFLLESVAQSIAGAVLGVVLGLAGVMLYCRYAEWLFYVSPLTVATAVVFGLTTGAVFGAYPALRAARLDPILALRQET